MAEETTKKTNDEFGGLAEAVNEKQIFRRFKPQSVAAKDWIFDLVKNGYRAKKRGGEIGMYMSDEMPEVGVLSIAPSLSALLSELALLKSGESTETEMSFKDVLTAKDPDSGAKNFVLVAVVNSIGKLLSECFPRGITDGINSVLFSSSPFYDDSGLASNVQWIRNGYLDAASWVFLVTDLIGGFLKRIEAELPPAALSSLTWKLNIIGPTPTEDGRIEDNEITVSYSNAEGGMEKISAAVRKLYVESVRVTCDCIVLRGKKAVGWSFRRMRNNGENADPSLYFSYVASTVYLGLYKRFNRGDNNIIGKLRGYEKLLNDNDEGRTLEFYKGITDDKVFAGNIKRIREIAKSGGNNGLNEFAKFLEKLTEAERAELDLLYNRINGGEPLSYKIRPNASGALFYTLKQSLIEFSEMLWNEGFGTSPSRVGFKVNMAKGPCFEDGSNVDMEALPRSSRDNSFFNNLLVIGILLNAAYDAELEARDKENGTDEYEQMFNVFQLSIQNTQRCYNEMANKGLLYKIDSYILDFSERVDDDNIELAKQLRRVNMAVVPLLPLMLKSNNLMSEYVVKYPQRQMTDSLKDIIHNRKPNGNGGAFWVWDKDGYNAITNYYYIDSLTAFYRYYIDYEYPCVEKEEDRRIREQKIINDAEAQRQKDLAELRAEKQIVIDELEAQLADVREVKRSISRFVVNGLIELVDEQLSADKLFASLDSEDRLRNEKVISVLKSVRSDKDTVKVSSLVDVLNKLRLLSLLTMSDTVDDTVSKLLGSGDKDSTVNYANIVSKLFGTDGNTAAFLLSMLKSVVGGKPKTDNQ